MKKKPNPPPPAVEKKPKAALKLTVMPAEELLGEDPFVEVEAAPLPDDTELAKVRQLAELQVALEARMAKGAALMKQLAEAHKDLSERQLPLAMRELGLETFSLTGGTKITVKKFIAASIPKPMTERAFDIIEKLGEGAIIKHAITILFGRDEDAWAAKFMRDMAQRKKPLNHSKKDWIEPPTLGKFVRDTMAKLRAEGRDPFTTLPKEVFGIYEGTRAEVELPTVR